MRHAQMLTTKSTMLQNTYMGRLPQILAAGLKKKTQRPSVRMSHAVDSDKMTTVMPSSFAMGTKPGPSMGLREVSDMYSTAAADSSPVGSDDGSAHAHQEQDEVFLPQRPV